ncbi:ankyrin repeat domain-containing protein [Streptosporangiaceae bacterium NEAU-GS5]|nr:ankyrin repeat domain-containing protein [Streptosporangiaceae bacterium NEAU-GS5]
MPSAGLPERPHLGQLRRQAKELKDAALSEDPVALERVRPYLSAGAPVTLATAQLAVAREHGFASWAKLKTEVDSRTARLAEQVSEFLRRSLIGSAAAVRLLRAEPGIAAYDIRTVAVLGEAETMRRLIAADPGAAVRVDHETGWPPLLYVCMSRWHRLALPEPEVAAEEASRRLWARAAGMVEVARLLLDAGADPNATVDTTLDTTVDSRMDSRIAGRPGEPARWSPLYAAAGRADNAAITALLLERGARPDDHTVYLAAFHADPRRPAPGIRPGLRGPAGHDCLRLLLRYHRLPAVSTALAAPISLDDAEGARLMLDAGADPNRPLPGELFGEAYRDEPAAPSVPLAIRLGCDATLVGLLLEHGGDTGAAGPDGLSPYRLAVREGRADIAELLLRHGARDEATVVDLFLTACSGADRDGATRLLREHPELRDIVTDRDRGVIVAAADRGDIDAVRLMLELGFPADTRTGPDAATALHAAARAGSADVVQILLAAGADVDARDSIGDASPLSWGVVGSGRRLGHNPHPDWAAAVRALLDAGADTRQAWAGDTFPSIDVARLLVERGINVPGKPVAAMRRSLGLDSEPG